MFFEVNSFFVNEADALGFEHCPLDSRASEGKTGSDSAVTVDNSVTRNISGFGVIVKRVPYNPCPPRISGEKSNLSVSCDLSFRNTADYLVNFFKCIQ